MLGNGIKKGLKTAGGIQGGPGSPYLKKHLLDNFLCIGLGF